MAIDGNRIGTVASKLTDDIAADHAEHPDATIKTVGLLVAVEYEDPESGDRRTRTHYRFVEPPQFENCPTYVALGLATQVAQDIAT